MALLEIDDIHVFYDKIEALKGISLAVEERQIVTLVGGNGAGKSTTLRAISGLLHPRSGRDPLRRRARSRDVGAHEIAAMGVVQVPEGRRIFARLTVDENLEMGAFTRHDRARIAEDKERMLALFPRLQGAPEAGRRHAVRRRAADGGDGARADGAAARAADGRAQHGPGADAGGAGVRDHPHASTRRA